MDGLTVNQLGKVQPDTRNPAIANAMEVLGLTENQHSGIPTVRRLMAEAGLPDPPFENGKDEFRATLEASDLAPASDESTRARDGFFEGQDLQGKTMALLGFCRTPRTRHEIVDFLGLHSSAYTMRLRQPAVGSGRLTLGLPDRPKSPRQTYQTS